MKCVLATFLLLTLLFVSCSRQKVEPEPASAAPKPKILTDSEARDRAASFANQELAGRTFKVFTVKGTEARPFPHITPAWWIVVTNNPGEQRWRLSREPPSGWGAMVSFDHNGSNPVLEKAYWADR